MPTVRIHRTAGLGVGTRAIAQIPRSVYWRAQPKSIGARALMGCSQVGLSSVVLPCVGKNRLPPADGRFPRLDRGSDLSLSHWMRASFQQLYWEAARLQYARWRLSLAPVASPGEKTRTCYAISYVVIAPPPIGTPVQVGGGGEVSSQSS